MNSNPPDHWQEQDYLTLLQEGNYNEILLKCNDFICRKVSLYLKRFPAYEQYTNDFHQEVCIHLLSRSLPSDAFIKACQNNTTFKFYLAKSVMNTLNTLLSKERQKKQKTFAIETIASSAENESVQSDKLELLTDYQYQGQDIHSDILRKIKHKFTLFLRSFGKTFPKLNGKLLLLLKLQARAPITVNDLQACFHEITSHDSRQLLYALGIDRDYQHKEDKEIYAIIHPYFRIYRQEKGSPSALQRWLNQHITGDKNNGGIMQRLSIREVGESFLINDKRYFSDFMYDYFVNYQPSQEVQQYQPSKNVVPIFAEQLVKSE